MGSYLRLAMKPPLIAIEGENTSGIDAQLQVIETGLVKAGYKVAVFKFPQYKNGSSYFIKESELGAYGNKLNPYAASTFYALDRFDAQKQIREALAHKDIIILANYMGYSMASQGINFQNLSQRKAFFVWLDGFETQMYGNLRPNHSFVISTGSNSQLNASYKSLCNDFPKDFSYLKLSKYTDSNILDILLENLPKKQASVEPKSSKSKKSSTNLLDLLRTQVPIKDIHITKEYIDIDGLNDHQKLIYRQGLEELNKIRNKILKEVPKDKIHYVSEFLSVLSSIVSYSGDNISRTITRQGEFENVLHDNIALQYSSGVRTGAELLEVYPRNQMTIVKDILFAVTDLSTEQIIEQTNKMPYESKAKLIKSYIQDGHGTGLNNLSYTFNIGTSLHNILWLKKTLKKELITIQEPSPRNGYKIPKFADKSSYLFEDFFDNLIDLNSKLSNTSASKYLVALGNIASAKIKVNYQDVKYLMQIKDAPQIAHDIVMQAKVTHPIIFE